MGNLACGTKQLDAEELHSAPSRIPNSSASQPLTFSGSSSNHINHALTKPSPPEYKKTISNPSPVIDSCELYTVGPFIQTPHMMNKRSSLSLLNDSVIGYPSTQSIIGIIPESAPLDPPITDRNNVSLLNYSKCEIISSHFSSSFQLNLLPISLSKLLTSCLESFDTLFHEVTLCQWSNALKTHKATINHFQAFQKAAKQITQDSVYQSQDREKKLLVENIISRIIKLWTNDTPVKINNKAINLNETNDNNNNSNNSNNDNLTANPGTVHMFGDGSWKNECEKASKIFLDAQKYHKRKYLKTVTEARTLLRLSNASSKSKDKKNDSEENEEKRQERKIESACDAMLTFYSNLSNEILPAYLICLRVPASSKCLNLAIEMDKWIIKNGGQEIMMTIHNKLFEFALTIPSSGLQSTDPKCLIIKAENFSESFRHQISSNFRQIANTFRSMETVSNSGLSKSMAEGKLAKSGSSNKDAGLGGGRILDIRKGSTASPNKLDGNPTATGTASNHIRKTSSPPASNRAVAAGAPKSNSPSTSKIMPPSKLVLTLSKAAPNSPMSV